MRESPQSHPKTRAKSRTKPRVTRLCISWPRSTNNPQIGATFLIGRVWDQFPRRHSGSYQLRSFCSFLCCAHTLFQGVCAAQGAAERASLIRPSSSPRQLVTCMIVASPSYFPVPLLQKLASSLTADGVIIFSTNFRRFKLDEEQLASAKAQEITKQTLPDDFRNRRVHRCWLISHQKRAINKLSDVE